MSKERTRYRYDVFTSYSSRNAAWVAAHLDVREVLELKGLDLARPRLEEADLLAMLKGNKTRSGKTPRLDNQLHQYLIVKSGNRHIQNYFRQYTATLYTSAFDYATPETHVVARMAAQHRTILEALIARHWARARHALAMHSVPRRMGERRQRFRPCNSAVRHSTHYSHS